jgi:hypothetical protein
LLFGLSLLDLLDLSQQVLGNQLVLAVQVLMEFVVEPGFRVQPVIFASIEDDSQLRQGQAFLTGVPFSFLAQILQDPIILPRQPLQRPIMISQELLMAKPLKNNPVEGIFGSPEIIIKNIRCILTDLIISFYRFFYFVLVN